MNFSTLAGYAAIGALAIGAATLALPRHVSVERSAVVSTAPQTVLALAASNQGYQRFNPYKTQDPNLKIDLFGPASGVGSGFHFDSKDGKGKQTVSQVTQESVVYAVDLGALGQPTQMIRATPVDGGTLVTWRADSDLGYNPLFRVFGLFMDRMMGPTLELGIDNLGKVAA
mgnify:FL=1